MTTTPEDTTYTPIDTRIDITGLTAVEIGELAASNRGLEVGWEDGYVTLTKVSEDARPVVRRRDRPRKETWHPPKWRG